MLKKQNKNIIVPITTIVIIIGVILAGNGIAGIYALDQAKQSAFQYVSDTAEFISYDSDIDKYTFRYFDAEQQERSEIEVDKNGGQIRKIQTQKVAGFQSGTVVLNNEELIKIVKKENPNANIKDIIPRDNQGNNYSTLTFVTSDIRGAYIVNDSNGIVLARTIKFGRSLAIPLSGVGDNESLLSLSEFKQIGNIKLPGAVFQDLDIIYTGGIFTAEIDLYLNGDRYELVLDACSGTELNYKICDDNWKDFGKWEPIELAIPLLNIVNYDVSLAVSKYKISPIPSAIPTEGIATSETESSQVEVSAVSPVPTLSIQTEPIKPSAPTKPLTGSVTKSQPSVPTNTASTPMPTTTIAAPTKAPTPTEVNGPKIIDTDRVKSLVLKRLPYAKFNEIDLDKDHGRLLYKGKATNKEKEVDFEIDAYSGIFVKWDVNTLDNYGNDDDKNNH